MRNGHDKPIKIHLATKNNLQKPLPTPPPSLPLQFTPDPLDKILSFEHFIVLRDNVMTFQIFSNLVGFNPSTLTYNVSNTSLERYNPIFLYGEEGSGKTHLLSAVALAMQKQNISVLYVKAETFTDHMIKAIRQGQMALFRNTYRQADVLLVDNIEHFANKHATQEEFFHTFNTYHMAGKQLILTSRLPPKKLERIEPRLISRFEWGIPLPLFKLPKDQLPLLLLKKLKLLNLSLPREVSEYLLAMFDTPKLLSQALDMLSYKSHLNLDPDRQSTITLDSVKTIIHALVEEASGKKLSPDKILQAVSEMFDVKKEELLEKGQSKDIVFPRQLAMYAMRHQLQMPYLKIGRVFSKDHSTVMSSIKQITQGIKNKEPRIVNNLDDLERKLSNH